MSKINIGSICKEIGNMSRIQRLVGLLGVFLVVGGFIMLLPKAFAAPTPVKSITIESSKLDYSKKEPGSYNIEKSAEWIEKGKARITFDLDTVMKLEKKHTDIIFVLDISGSMEGDKLNRVKQDSIELINTLLSDSNNRAALITFETSSKIVSSLTNNKNELIDKVNMLITTGSTNYYSALVNVDNVLKDYEKKEDGECIVLFLTDGYPNVDIPNEEGQYNYLKKQYPYITINGIQYEMGTDILEPIKKVSDSQFIADMTNLNNVLFEASVAPIIYDSFSITDYINDDYFEIESVDSITSSVGSTKLEYEGATPKVIWDIKNLRSGSSATLTIDVNLKKEYIDKGGLYPTNKKEEVKSEIDKIKEDITSTNTPVLADNYKVIYDGNAPGDCVIENVPATTNKSVFETVEISNNVPVCGDYQFKGWSIATENVKKIGDNHFTMPESDVVIRANWGKMDIAKSIDGEVFKVQTLYKVVADQAFLDNTESEFVSSSSGINFGSPPSNTNGKGVYTISSTKDNEYPVHYFRGEVANNNVKFANICWKIVRTTETGGVKLIYNGLPNINGGCANTKGEVTIIGNSTFNSESSSLSDVGYMYGGRYQEYWKSTSSWYVYAGKTYRSKANMKTTEYYYGNSVTYDDATRTYSIVNAKKHLWSSDYRSLRGTYTCFSNTEDGCAEVSYIESVESERAGYISMIWGETYDNLMEKANNYKWIYGNDVEYVDGTYILKDIDSYSPMTFREDAKTGFNAHRYTCFSKEDSCTSVNYLYYNTYYITLTDGKKVDDALNEMVSNENNSTIKTMIDDWYSNSMTNYTKYLEDTVWCNDRSISMRGGWNKDSTTNSSSLYFGGRERNDVSYKPSIECPNLNDSFTVSSEVGNGKLTYPVALLTADEATFAGSGKNGYSKSNYLYTEKPWFLLTPASYTEYDAYVFYEDSSGYLNGGYRVNYSFGVRPSISLAPGVMISYGNGTSNLPYEVFLPEIG